MASMTFEGAAYCAQQGQFVMPKCQLSARAALHENFLRCVASHSQAFVSMLLIAAILLLTSPQAWAHAIVVESTPAADAVISGAALDIKLRFNSRIDGRRSKLILVSPDGASHDVTPLAQASPDSISAKASELVPGKYQLRWQVLANDGHITRGSIPFSVVRQ